MPLVFYVQNYTLECHYCTKPVSMIQLVGSHLIEQKGVKQRLVLIIQMCEQADMSLIFCKAQLICTNIHCLYKVLSFYEMKSFTGGLWNNDIMVNVPKCPK